MVNISKFWNLLGLDYAIDMLDCFYIGKCWLKCTYLVTNEYVE